LKALCERVVRLSASGAGLQSAEEKNKQCSGKRTACLVVQRESSPSA